MQFMEANCRIVREMVLQDKVGFAGVLKYMGYLSHQNLLHGPEVIPITTSGASRVIVRLARLGCCRVLGAAA